MSRLQDIVLAAKYLRVVAVHKWAIVVAGRDVNRVVKRAGLHVSLRRLLAHDLSKLTRAELMPYARHFGQHRHGPDPAFEAAWHARSVTRWPCRITTGTRLKPPRKLAS